MSNTTRDRIVTEAMRLFGEHGYRGTTIVKIEAAAGLTPGAGGLYHHFGSKDAVLAAGIERQLARLDAVRDIRRVFPLGDLKAELTLIARYLLAALDDESELLRIVAFEGRNRPQVLTDAVEQLVHSAFTGFATWIAEHADGRMTSEQAAALSAVGLGSLFSSRLMRDVLGVAIDVDDQALVDTWVQAMTAMLEHGVAP